MIDLFVLLAFLPSIIVAFCVCKKSKTFSLLSSLGSVQEMSSREGDSEKMEQSADAVHLVDKLVYMFGVMNVALTSFLIGNCPTLFYLWHTPKFFILTFFRWWTFRKVGQHYLLYDFCYWANLLTVFYVWVLPTSAVLFQIVFVVAFGPLAWSSLAFHHSLIFHSHAHMTSVFIHFSPMVLAFGLRWYPSTRFVVCNDYPVCKTGLIEMVGNATTKFYLWWIVLYYLWVFVIKNRRVQEKHYATLFDRVITKQLKFIAKVHSNVFVQKALYVTLHLAFGLVVMTFSALFWNSFWAQLVFIVCIFATISYNAAGYYFTVFLETTAPTSPKKS